MIRACDSQDFDTIWNIINDGAAAYRGGIPENRWHEPYISKSELRDSYASRNQSAGREPA